MMEMYWLIDEELLNSKPELKKDLINTLIGMRAVLKLEEETIIKMKIGNDKIALAYLKALDKSAIHAYCKRLTDLEEYRQPETLLAILQYEFQARMLLKKTEVPISIKWYVEYVEWLISSFAKRWEIELFEDTGLLIGYQHRCSSCNKVYFSEEILSNCTTCKLELVLEEICTYPDGYKIERGNIMATDSGGFAPSNGSEEKSIESIKKLLGVK